MICCDRCDHWYHAECCGISVEKAEAMSNYICKGCGGTQDSAPILVDEGYSTDDDPDSPLPIDPRLMNMSATSMFGIGLGMRHDSYR